MILGELIRVYVRGIDLVKTESRLRINNGSRGRRLRSSVAAVSWAIDKVTGDDGKFILTLGAIEAVGLDEAVAAVAIHHPWRSSPTVQE